MLKIKKGSEQVIALDETGDLLLSGHYTEEELNGTEAGELRLGRYGDGKLGTAPPAGKRRVLLEGRLFSTARFPGEGLQIKAPGGGVVTELDLDGNLYVSGGVTNALANPADQGTTTFQEVVYAAQGLDYTSVPVLDEYTDFENPTSGYQTRTIDLSDFTNLGYPDWTFTNQDVPINGLLRVPDGDGPFPLALFVHGNHTPFDVNWSGTIYPGDNSTPGYVYLMDLLASHGIIAGSVDCNFLNGGSGENDGRAIVHLEHVKQFKMWNEQSGHPLFGKVDMDRVMIAGHSRGGEGVGHASLFNTLDDIQLYSTGPTVPLDGSQGLGPYHFNLKAIVAIAPTDNQYQPVGGKTVVNDHYFVLAGSRDGDVSSFSGYLTYDRAHPADLSNPTSVAQENKSLLWIYGANHNYFNSEWSADPKSTPTLQRPEQEHVAKVYIGALAQARLLGRSQYMTLFKNHKIAHDQGWIPQATRLITQYQDKERLFITHFQEDIDMSSVSPGVNGSIDHANVQAQELNMNSGSQSHLYQETRGLRLDWTQSGDSYVININSGGLPPGRLQNLVLRAGQSNESNNQEDAKQDFTIVVTDGDSSCSFLASTVAELPYPDDPPRDNGTYDRKTVMQTIRIPMRLLEQSGCNVKDIRQITLLFDQPIEGTATVEGTLYVDDIQVAN